MIVRPCMHSAMLSVRFGTAESDTEGSLHTYGALLLTYNRCHKLLLNDSKAPCASSDTEGSLHTYGALLLTYNRC